MKQLLEVLGFVALVQGVLGLVQEITGEPHGWGLGQRLGFLDGHEIYASATLLVLAVALFAAAASRRPG
ncbi:hypothetical protein [Streptomyces rhizosphaerihabitans]|uniref:hypothetical protein n=1 Tax=Streptomyces rhizosphaerihabitans TaxID=1266770 RepID=UPI0021BF33A7|nr:hypothetical protein [Streptomyces rhizosphaerihabitans]MCT9006196.1 hypothetical protein [Streptomyces rhizosphaerihabitans]